MINYDTIISNFDDKVTLYNWLHKVEEALKNASATNFVVNKKGNATLSFSITFADGETLESGDIVLQQGESVDQARIASGVLQLHLTNGTWLTAGNIKPVSNFNINASQHLIVNYQDNTSQDLGAIFNGNVNIAGNFTSDSIIENMTGYRFEIKAPSNSGINISFASSVKNGNKITFVIAGSIIRNENTPYNVAIGQFICPTSVMNKLYPLVSGGSTVDIKDIVFIKANDLAGANVKLTGQLGKNGNYGLTLQIIGIGGSSLTLEQNYIFRYETTFLLSDNLAQ